MSRTAKETVLLIFYFKTKLVCVFQMFHLACCSVWDWSGFCNALLKISPPD